MTRAVLLNNVEHQDLRVISERGADYGDQVMSVLTFPDEFRSVQADFPIVFAPSKEGQSYQALALFGFTEGQNLFLVDGHWQASYVPLALERQPFLIGNANGEPVVHIDLDHSRVSRNRGEPLFLPHGGNSEFLEHISSVLQSIHQGWQRSDEFVAAVIEHDLLESFVLDVGLRDGSQHRLSGFYTINEERLMALEGAALEALNRAGFLSPIYMALASLSNFKPMIERLQQQSLTDGD